jgi:hypothetical protein
LLEHPSKTARLRGFRHLPEPSVYKCGKCPLVVLLVALWTALVHAGAAEDKLLAQRIIEESWPELVSACRLGLTLQPQPEWDTPLDGALRAR